MIDETLKNGYKKFNFIKRLKTSKGYIDEEVYIKSKDSKMMKVRLVGNKLSNKIASIRIRKNVLKNNKQNISSELKILLHWNLVITNVPEEKLGRNIITELYRLRWQIELLFKVLKSTFSIDKLNTGSKNYAETIIYSRLLAAILTMPVYDLLNHNALQNKGRGVSMFRFYKLYTSYVCIIATKNLFKLTTYHEFCSNMLRITKLSLTEKRVRQTAYAKIENLLQEFMGFGKT